MTPAARIAAAIGVLDLYLADGAAEQVLTRWARGARYAGSGDRAAVRDHVFGAIRRLRSDAALGGGQTGRGLMLGALRRQGIDPATIFTGAPYAPAILDADEMAGGRSPVEMAEELDIPDWLWPQFSAGLGGDAMPAAKALQMRAPVHLRVNLTKGDRDSAIADLAGDGVKCVPLAQVETALLVQEGPRRIRQSEAYRSGLVELQDAASQAVVNALPLAAGMRVLDYCAGGGGKALAMAARTKIDLYVHDIAQERMGDLPDRAARAGVDVTYLETENVARSGPFDLVLCDVPCSGSGAWRRSPDGKWNLTQETLQGLVQTQAEILNVASGLVGPSGVLAYATCSLLNAENSDQIARFLQAHPGWRSDWHAAWPVHNGTDGFFSAHLTRETSGG